MSCAGHIFGNVDFAKRQEYVEFIVAKLRRRVKNFSHIAVSGYSSAVMGSIIAHRLKKDIAIVRKPNEQRNSYHDVEFEKPIYKYVFIDDLCASGGTIARVFNALEVEKCYAVLLYHGRNLDTDAADKKAHYRRSWESYHVRVNSFLKRKVNYKQISKIKML